MTALRGKVVTVDNLTMVEGGYQNYDGASEIRVEWSTDENEWIARLSSHPWAIGLGDSHVSALADLCRMLAAGMP